MCAGVPRIFTSGPLDSKLRVSGLWFFRLLFRPRPRRFCCPCLTAQMAPVLLELLSSMSIPRACEHGSLAPGDRLWSRHPSAAHLQPEHRCSRVPRSGPTRHHHPHAGSASTAAIRSSVLSRANSGADDRSPCCEQSKLRIGPCTRSSLPNKPAARCMHDSTGPSLSRNPQESKGFVAYVQFRVLAATHRRRPATSR